MGIVNVTPDSFSDGGAAFAADRGRCAHCERLIARGRRHPGHRRRIDPAGQPAGAAGRGTGPRAAGGARSGAAWACRCRWTPTSRRSCGPCSIWAPTSSTTSGRCGSRARCEVGGRASGVRRLPDAHAPRSADHAGGADGMATWWPQVRAFLAQRVPALRAAGRGSDRHRRSTRASASARPSAQNFALLARPARIARAGLSAAGGLVAQVVAGRGHAASSLAASAWLPSVAAAVLAVERGARSCACTMCAKPSRRWRSGVPCRTRHGTKTGRDPNDTTIFRHRRHPRHGGSSRRSRRTSCCASRMRSAACSRRPKRARRC